MGPKVSLKKIENKTKCQVTFSKRRSSLIKKAKEISICCDSEVALVAFSPSGRLSKFSSPKRMEEVIDRYVNLPPDRRFNDIDNVQEKLEKLRQLDHVKGDKSKLHYLDKQLENRELQIKKSTIQLQILETEIGVYEPQGQEEPTLNQLIWLERNINNSLGKVIARKNIIRALQRGKNNFPMQMAYHGVTPFFNNFLGHDSNDHGSKPSHGKLPMRLDPWLVPHSAEVRDGRLQSLINQEFRNTIHNQGIDISTGYSTCNITKGNQPQGPLIAHESQFVPPVENSFRSVAQNDPEISSWNVFGIGSFSRTLHEIQPMDLERTTPLSLYENHGTGFAFNNGDQIATDKTQAHNDQIFLPSGQLNINHPTVFNNTNIHNSCKNGNGREIEDSNPLKNLMKDNTPWTSHSQAGENGLSDRDWDILTYDDINNLLE